MRRRKCHIDKYILAAFLYVSEKVSINDGITLLGRCFMFTTSYQYDTDDGQLNDAI